MNTYRELIDKYGLNDRNARQILDMCRMRMEKGNRDFDITDIEYVGDSSYRIEQKCRHCGTVIYKEKKRGYKWSHIQGVCDCQREKAKMLTRENAIKRALGNKEQRENERYSVLQNAIGKEYGEFVVQNVSMDFVLLKCKECGAEKNVGAISFLSGTWSDQKCHTHRRMTERFTESYIGMKNNMLTVTGITKDEKTGKKRFVCLCDCGKTTLVKPSLWERGYITSCGCYLENRSKDADPIKRIKGIHKGIMTRCYKETNRDYPMYGGRGITICPEWQNVESFIQWSLENGYDNTKTIDRIDFNGNYEPGNCRWTTWDIQCRNKRPRAKKGA